MTSTNAPKPQMPEGLSKGGQKLWRDTLRDFDQLTAAQQVLLTEACRAKDRADKLDAVLRGDGHTWMHLLVDGMSDGTIYELRITNALGKANEVATEMKQLLAAMRLPDLDTGKVPQRRAARGSYSGAGKKAPEKKNQTVTSMERHQRRAQTG